MIFHGSNNRLDRSRDRNDNNYQNHPRGDRDRERDNEGDYDDDNYHHQNYRGGYNQRRGGYPMPFNPYYPTYPPMMGYVDPRR